jgi:uncharacterized integral membrane protein
MRRFAWYLLALPIGIVLVTLAVINTHPVRFVLDPFRAEEPALSLLLPFYVYLLLTLMAGVVIGGTVVWRTQARWRRMARRRGAEAVRWQAEADRLSRERDKPLAVAGPQR